jgi:hypothetical protein
MMGLGVLVFAPVGAGIFSNNLSNSRAESITEL